MAKKKVKVKIPRDPQKLPRPEDAVAAMNALAPEDNKGRSPQSLTTKPSGNAGGQLKARRAKVVSQLKTNSVKPDPMITAKTGPIGDPLVGANTMKYSGPGITANRASFEGGITANIGKSQQIDAMEQQQMRDNFRKKAKALPAKKGAVSKANTSGGKAEVIPPGTFRNADNELVIGDMKKFTGSQGKKRSVKVKKK